MARLSGASFRFLRQQGLVDTDLVQLTLTFLTRLALAFQQGRHHRKPEHCLLVYVVVPKIEIEFDVSIKKIEVVIVFSVELALGLNPFQSILFTLPDLR